MKDRDLLMWILYGIGGFQLEFVSISQVINHMTCFTFELSLVEITAFRLESKSCKGFFKISFPPMRALKFRTGHGIYNPAYTYKFQLKPSYLSVQVRSILALGHLRFV